jgi:hypothetical protein
MKAFADSHGNVFALYRAASEKTNRNETLLLSRNHGADFNIVYSNSWRIDICPMSSAFLFESQTSVLAAAETHGRVFYVRIDSATGTTSSPVSPETKGKYPVAIANPEGEVLFVWTEDTAWAKGGSVAWQTFDKEGKATSEKGRAGGVPAWSFASAYVRPDGRFVIIY